MNTASRKANRRLKEALKESPPIPAHINNEGIVVIPGLVDKQVKVIKKEPAIVVGEIVGTIIRWIIVSIIPIVVCWVCPIIFYVGLFVGFIVLSGILIEIALSEILIEAGVQAPLRRGKMKPCKTCNKEISVKAKMCPLCGEPNPMLTTKKNEKV